MVMKRNRNISGFYMISEVSQKANLHPSVSHASVTSCSLTSYHCYHVTVNVVRSLAEFGVRFFFVDFALCTLPRFITPPYHPASSTALYRRQNCALYHLELAVRCIWLLVDFLASIESLRLWIPGTPSTEFWRSVTAVSTPPYHSCIIYSPLSTSEQSLIWLGAGREVTFDSWLMCLLRQNRWELISWITFGRLTGTLWQQFRIPTASIAGRLWESNGCRYVCLCDQRWGYVGRLAYALPGSFEKEPPEKLDAGNIRPCELPDQQQPRQIVGVMTSTMSDKHEVNNRRMGAKIRWAMKPPCGWEEISPNLYSHPADFSPPPPAQVHQKPFSRQ